VSGAPPHAAGREVGPRRERMFEKEGECNNPGI
jgi:hypothetical protein